MDKTHKGEHGIIWDGPAEMPTSMETSAGRTSADIDGTWDAVEGVFGDKDEAVAPEDTDAGRRLRELARKVSIEVTKANTRMKEFAEKINEKCRHIRSVAAENGLAIKIEIWPFANRVAKEGDRMNEKDREQRKTVGQASVLPMFLDDGSALYCDTIAGGSESANGFPSWLSMTYEDSDGKVRQGRYGLAYTCELQDKKER